jgi:hypothetical protein
VSSGSTALTGVELFDSPTCGSLQNRPEDAWQFTAPRTGTWSLVTTGFDTVLVVLSECGGTELACNDENPTTSDSGSRVDLEMTAGDSVLVLVTGYEVDGTYNLSVTQQL